MVTRQLAELALSYRYEALPYEVRALSARCMLDAMACALAGIDEPVCRIVRAEVMEQGGAGEATIFSGGRVPATQAAVANGTAAHALDYDDVNTAIPGHASAVMMPAVLALAEATGATGCETLTAFVAGYEVACRVGWLVGPGHYDRGFHATATAGAIGAAAAAARLLRLSPAQAASALALGATQASGLKALFGNMGKPLHAGLAARNGLFAARLVLRGFDAGDDALEHAQGFGRAMSDDFRDDKALPSAAEFFILRNLFKYHAACYGTHSAIECANRLRAEHGLRPEAITRATVTANPASDKYCNICEPRTPNEGKFSLRLNAAFGLLGIDTSRLDAYNESRILAPSSVALRDRVEVRFDPGLPMMKAAVEVQTASGERYSTVHDAGEPETDFAIQARRVACKFDALAEPILGPARSAHLKSLLLALDDLPTVRPVLEATLAL